MSTYSFTDITATLTGATGIVDLGYGTQVAKEGITVSMSSERDVQTIGADGSVMHSLKCDKSGTATIRLMATSPANAKLLAMYNAQALVPASWGANVITIRNKANDEVIVCRDCAFQKLPDVTFDEEGTSSREWVFNCGKIDSISGTY